MGRSQSPILRLRARIPGEEFDYLALLDAVRDYASPRDAITGMLSRGEIVRVKKGVYVFGGPYSRGPYSREVLANMIYGPSYISFEYALQWHGLIPEGVEVVTSAALGRVRRFETPVGVFAYRPTTAEAYPFGVRLEGPPGRSYLLAGPEKALADSVRGDRGSGVSSAMAMETYLLDHLRIDPLGLATLDSDLLSRIAAAYRSRKVRLLASVVAAFASEHDAPDARS